MNNVIKNNINFQDMTFCKIIETNHYIQNYDSDTISDSDSNSDIGSYFSYSSSSSFSPISTNSTNSIDSTNSVDLEQDDNYWLRPQRTKNRNRLKPYSSYTKSLSSELNTDLDKNCPFINNLIDKRINSCVVGPSSHIAAFLPSTVEIRSCFLSNWKRKGRNR